MIAITDNDTLLQYIPNVVETVEGETPLFDKIRPQLEITEQWLHDTIVGDTLIDEEKNKMVCTIIACEAFRRSVPSLDIILAPASKERVERLMASLGDLRDKALAALLNVLRQDSTWLQSAQGQWLASSFFVLPDEDTTAASAAVRTDDKWEGFLMLREKARPIEQAIAEKWLGQALTARLRATLASDPHGTSDVVSLARTVRQLVIDELLSGKRPVKNLDRCVNYIRNNSTLYPEWQSDPVAELFDDKWRFQNKKEAAGYFF